MAKIGVVFLDVGGTLGSVDSQLQLHPFASTKNLLKSLRDTLGMRLGVISNVPADMNGTGLKNLLEKAGLLSFFDDHLIIASTDAGASKPAAAIYQTAASHAGVPPDQCMYIGEAADEVAGAISAKMAGILKPAG